LARFQTTVAFAANRVECDRLDPDSKRRRARHGRYEHPDLALVRQRRGHPGLDVRGHGRSWHDNNSYPAPIRITSVTTPTMSIKVVKGKKAERRRRVTVLQIQF